MRKCLPLLFLLFTVVSETQAQFTRYLVKLKNKGGTPYTFTNPLAYLSQRSIDRRTRYAIAIDSADLPATPSYITQIRNVPNVTVLNVSKWLNQVSIQTSDPNAINTISGFAFVQGVSSLAARAAGFNNDVTRNKFEMEEILTELPLERNTQTTADFFNYGTASFNEIHLHNGEFLHNIGLRGQGMVITLLDGGFFNYTGLKAFDSANLNGQILSTWDFVNREASVVEDNSHGMNCLSTIVANIPGQFIGKAPKASFHLFRTEDVASEYPIEEQNWICGAERADSLGAEVISSSLGYYQFDNASFNYTYNDMNGRTTMSAKGAAIGIRKGLLIFNALGNEGNNSWHFLISPADADSIAGVGAVNAAGTVGSFSSYGPSSDGQIKPDVASVGVSALVQGTNNTIGGANGTSFACPNMAGLGTCLWQGFPEFNNMKILDALRRAGSIFASPNDRIGYGIPNMKTAFTNLLVDFATSGAATNACNITLSWTSKDIAAMKYEIERKAPGDPDYIRIADFSPSPGVILANHSYQFVNALTSGTSGMVSYRIRQVVDTATATFTAAYIDTANVTVSACPADPGPDKVFVRPNPSVNQQVTLDIKTDYAVADMPISIFDMKGRLVMRLQRSKGAGQTSITIPIAGLAAGEYIIKVYNKDKTIGTTALMKL